MCLVKVTKLVGKDCQVFRVVHFNVQGTVDATNSYYIRHGEFRKASPRTMINLDILRTIRMTR